MIEIIKEHVEMPTEKRYVKKIIKNKWVVWDNQIDKIRYKSSFDNCLLACHNLNKKHYMVE